MATPAATVGIEKKGDDKATTKTNKDGVPPKNAKVHPQETTQTTQRSSRQKRLAMIPVILFTVVSFVNGQYIPKPLSDKHRLRKCHSISFSVYAILLTTVLGLTVNTYPSAVILADWSKCPLNYFGVCYTIVLHSQGNQSDTTDLPDIVLRDTDPGRNINNSRTSDELENFEDFAKLALFFSAFSGWISYLIFVYILWHKYISQLFPWDRICFKGTTKKAEELAEDEERLAEDEVEDEEQQPLLQEHQQQEAEEGSNKAVLPLHPFDNKESSDTSTYLDGKESGWFFLFYIINLSLVIGMVVVFCVGQYHHPLLSNDRIDSSKIHKFHKWEISTVVAYSYSLICTISSCFVFSKVMYGIQRKCSNLEGDFLAHQNELGHLIGKDKEFVDTSIKTQSIFELWFFVHWVMFIISSFLSLSLLIEAIDLNIKATLPHKKPGINFYPWEMFFLALFAASNSFFFLYPCIRAAGVTESRKILIREVNNGFKEGEVKTTFINYLKGQKFCFRLNILCAHVAFNLNIAYISIFIGLLGVLIKIGASL